MVSLSAQGLFLQKTLFTWILLWQNRPLSDLECFTQSAVWEKLKNFNYTSVWTIKVNRRVPDIVAGWVSPALRIRWGFRSRNVAATHSTHDSRPQASTAARDKWWPVGSQRHGRAETAGNDWYTREIICNVNDLAQFKLWIHMIFSYVYS